MESFPQIEKITKTNINIYTKVSKNDIVLVTKGQNPNVTDDRNVYLLLITEGDNQHVALYRISNHF